MITLIFNNGAHIMHVSGVTAIKEAFIGLLNQPCTLTVVHDQGSREEINEAKFQECCIKICWMLQTGGCVFVGRKAFWIDKAHQSSTGIVQTVDAVLKYIQQSGLPPSIIANDRYGLHILLQSPLRNN